MKILAVCLLFAAAALLVGQPALCAWCPSYTCYAPCSQQCSCMVEPGNPGGGRCVSFWAVPKLRDAGWMFPVAQPQPLVVDLTRDPYR